MESSSADKLSALINELPKQPWYGADLYNWKGFWYRPHQLSSTMAASSNFRAKDDDVILTSSMKTGTTWMKAIIPTIMNPVGRTDDDSLDPLLKHHPNELIPSLEIQVYSVNPNPDLSNMVSPRLFRTHMAYPLLSESIKTSGCKIVYITRDPKDTFVSTCHFMNSVIAARGVEPWPMSEAFESFCKGEDMKKDPKGEVKKLACFLGSLERLKNLEMNQHGVDTWLGIDYKHYFRRGIVGDWKSHFTDEMKEKLDQLTAMKFEGYGLSLGC
ncbi:hypothetical protein CXB51_030640 [Gossypium anomalum]|uniref:Sulfotransferase n=1 Tax=Gossypium anomalum TaxID=47600 RepID=A0A8J6CQX7_9ROSI|nr:hypothetical protein CXB51_030640 [Gossypium anomalum]